MIRSLIQITIGIVIAACIPYVVTSSYYLDVICYAAILAIYALGVAVVFGQLGYPTFGHAAFFGIGAYTAGLLVAKAGLDYWSVVALSIVPGALLGLLVGLVAARLSGAYFAIATLTVAGLLGLLANNWEELTRGPIGTMVTITPLPLPAALGWGAQQSYTFVLISVLSLIIVLLGNLLRGPVGRSWIAIREAPALAEALGIATSRARVLNVMVSGAIASLAGGLLVPKVLVISPDLFGISYSATGMLAVILGGKATLIGPVIGGAIFAVLPELFRPLGDYNLAAFALIMLLVVRMLPAGVASMPWLSRLVAFSPPAGTANRSPGAALVFHANPGSTAPLLEADSLNKRFGGVTAVNDVSFSVRAGEIVGLIGPNGAGKTTLFNLLTGFQKADSGQIRAFGQGLGGFRPYQSARRGLVRTFQQTAVCDTLSVAQNALIAAHLAEPTSFFASMFSTPAYRRREQRRLERAMSCLDELGLAQRSDEIAGSLPYGEKKLLGVAMALAAGPRLLLLDEPAAGLNQTEAQRLAAELRKLRDKGLTLIVVDHNLSMLMSIADRIVMLHHGVKIGDGLPAEVTADPKVVAAYLGTPEKVEGTES